MQILVIAATEQEIAPFLKLNSTADHLFTGVGAAATVYHLTKRLHQIDYDLVIQAGIAGSFSDNLKCGEVVLIKKDAFADVGIYEKNTFSTIFESGLGDENEFPFKKGWLVNEEKILNDSNLKIVSGVTVNTVTDNKESIKSLSEKFNVEVESMEGAALHYVCLHEHVPFLQLRSISNYVGERDKTKWKMSQAIENLNKELGTLYRLLTATSSMKQ